jgi:hypothetical protein
MAPVALRIGGLLAVSTVAHKRPGLKEKGPGVKSRPDRHAVATEQVFAVLSKVKVFAFSSIFLRVFPTYLVLSPAMISALETGFP